MSRTLNGLSNSSGLAYALIKPYNLFDVPDKAAARLNLGFNGTLTGDNYITMTPFNATSNSTINLNVTTSGQANKILALDPVGNLTMNPSNAIYTDNICIDTNFSIRDLSNPSRLLLALNNSTGNLTMNGSIKTPLIYTNDILTLSGETFSIHDEYGNERCYWDNNGYHSVLNLQCADIISNANIKCSSLQADSIQPTVPEGDINFIGSNGIVLRIDTNQSIVSFNTFSAFGMYLNPVTNIFRILKQDGGYTTQVFSINDSGTLTCGDISANTIYCDGFNVKGTATGLSMNNNDLNDVWFLNAEFVRGLTVTATQYVKTDTITTQLNTGTSISFDEKNITNILGISCGAITSSGALNLGANTITCGAITSSGNLSLGTRSILCGAINCGAITSSGNLALGSRNITCGTISAGSIGSTTSSCGTLVVESSPSPTITLNCVGYIQYVMYALQSGNFQIFCQTTSTSILSSDSVGNITISGKLTTDFDVSSNKVITNNISAKNLWRVLWTTPPNTTANTNVNTFVPPLTAYTPSATINVTTNRVSVPFVYQGEKYLQFVGYMGASTTTTNVDFFLRCYDYDTTFTALPTLEGSTIKLLQGSTQSTALQAIGSNELIIDVSLLVAGTAYVAIIGETSKASSSGAYRFVGQILLGG